MKQLRVFILFSVFAVMLPAYTYAGATLRVHTSSPCTADNIWSGWHNIARPWLWIEYNKPWRNAKVWVHDRDHSYSRNYNITKSNDPSRQWIEDLASGSYSWSVNFEVDMGGGHYQWTEDISGPDFYVDRTPPVISSYKEDHSGATTTYHSYLWKTHNSPHFIFSGSDAHSGLNRFEMSVNGGSYFTVSSGYHPTLNDGRYRFRLRAIDNIGLIRDASYTLYLNVDAHAPNPPTMQFHGCTASDTPWPAWSRIASPFVYVYPGSDGSGSGAAVNRVSVNGGDYLNLPIQSGRSRWRPTFASGTYVLDFITEDKVHLVSTVTRKYIRIDVDKPSLELLFPAHDTLIGADSIEIQWQGSDPHSGMDHYEYSFDSVVWTGVSADTSVVLRNLTDSSYTVFVKAVDVAGNDSICKVIFSIDATPPELVITSPPQDTLFNSDSITLAWSGRDTTSGLREYEYSSDSITWTSCSTDTSMVVKDLPDGLHTMYVRATDKANNCTVQQVSFTTDITAPQFSDDLQNSILDADANCTATLPDYFDSITVTDNLDDTLTITQMPAPGTLVAGDTTTVILRATDDAGNSAEVSFHVSVADVTAPVCSCHNDTTVVVPEGDTAYTVSGAVFDLQDVSDNCDYTVTNDLNGIETLANTSLPVGSTAVIWTVTDAAGNSTSCSTSITVTRATGIGQEEKCNITVYPNPVQDELTLVTDLKEYTVRIIALSGEVKMERNGLSLRSQINMARLSPGFYLVKILTRERTVVRKIIKK